MRVYLLGPVAWVAGLVAVAYVVHRGNAVGIALLVLAGAFLLALTILLAMRARRVREEREP